MRDGCTSDEGHAPDTAVVGLLSFRWDLSGSLGHLRCRLEVRRYLQVVIEQDITLEALGHGNPVLTAPTGLKATRTAHLDLMHCVQELP